MAASRTLELTLISAKDVQDVNLFSKMEVYAVASIDGDPRTQQRTPADRGGGRSPSWNHSLRLPVPSGDPSRHALVVLLRAQRALGDRDVGEVRIPLSEILSGAAVGGPQSLSYQVRKPSSGKPKGVLNLSYKLSDPIAVEAKPPKAAADLGSAYPAYPPPSGAAAAYPPPAAYPPSAYPPPSGAAAAYPPPAAYPPSAYPPPVKESKVNVPATAYPPPSKASSKADEPVTAYPAPGPSTGFSYPPPVGAAPYPPPGGYPGHTHGYAGAPPPAGYGYQPPQNGGYGYPPQAAYGYGQQPMMAPQAPKKKNKFGMGLGAGLLGGALGGMLIGDMVSDGGFDDGGGFDF